ncbi:MAG: hypothetical protein ABI216_18470 [Devosia sp.]
MALEPTRKLMNILYASANGRLPWGQDWIRDLPLCDGLIDDDGKEYDGYVLCCGHTLKYGTESANVVGAGLMMRGNPDRFGRSTLTITKVGRAYLAQHMNMVAFDG